jgi:hypothetical protein
MYPKEKVGRLQLLPIFGNGKAERYGDFFLKLCDEHALGSIVVTEKYENIFWQQVGGRVHTFNPVRDNLTTEGER